MFHYNTIEVYLTPNNCITKIYPVVRMIIIYNIINDLKQHTHLMKVLDYLGVLFKYTGDLAP